MTDSILPLNPAIEVTLVTSESTPTVDVAVLSLSFFDGDGQSRSDAVVVVRDRETGRRVLTHYQHRPDGFHFAAALELRESMLGGQRCPRA